MDTDDENSKKNKGRSRAGRTRGRGRAKPKGRTKKAVKVIESDDDDVSQTGDDNAMDTSINEQEIQEELPQNHQAQQAQQTSHTPHSQQPPQTQHQQHSQHTQHAPTIPQTTQPVVQQPVQQPVTHPKHHHSVIEQQFDLEADISQLEAPTFTTINRGPPEPMLRLRWDHRVNLIGEKVLNPMIHCCDKCLKPILIYGRMIPCKHVFCLSCAKREDKVCPRCMEKVSRVEQTGLGTVFMCTHGGTRYGNAGCRRTYLSPRDLQAHINHRHVAAPPPQPVQSMQLDGPPAYMQHGKGSDMLIDVQHMSKSGPNNRMKPISSAHMVPTVMGNDPRVNAIGVNQTPSSHDHRSSQSHRHYSQSSSSSQQQSSNAQMRSNLITVPIQDTNTLSAHDLAPQQQSHHYYHPDNHVGANLTARHVVLTGQPPPPPPQVNYGGYGVNVVPPPAPTQQYYGAQHAHPTQMAYVNQQPQQQQQQYGTAPRSAYGVQEAPYAQSQPPPPQPQQQQWNQHQQQFYR